MTRWDKAPDSSFFESDDLKIKVRAKRRKDRPAAKIVEEMLNWYIHTYTAEFFKDCMIAYNLKIAQDGPMKERNESAGGTI